MDPYTMQGVGEGIERGIKNYYSLQSLKQGMKQQEESAKDEHKINQLKIKQLENQMTPERIKQQNEINDMQYKIQKNTLTLKSNILDEF